MRIDKTRCDRCGFDQPNPTPFIAQAVVKMRRATEQTAGVDWTGDLCVPCFDVVQATIADVMKSS